MSNINALTLYDLGERIRSDIFYVYSSKQDTDKWQYHIYLRNLYRINKK